MLIGYVSDERYVALCDVQLEFEGPSGVIETRSSASGAVRAAIDPGSYRVTLAKPGFGSKRVAMTVREGEPYHFRLLSDGLLGYVWPKWVRSGELAEFRVHSVVPFSLSLYRNGLQRERVSGLGWFDEHGPRATMQITPDGDYSQTGVRWNEHGYTSPHHKQFIAAPERSGLYYFHAATASGGRFAFPWIVAPARPKAPIAVLASNITWNAYNAFGGRSNYIHPDQLPPTPTVNSRLELKRYTDPTHKNYDAAEYAPLAFDRPEPVNDLDFDEAIEGPIHGRSACHLAPAEWRLLGWLEREGFPYDYYAETQFHEGLVDLDAYRVLILSTHPEYWSRSMFQRLKSWVFDRGGKLMYLGGNGLNCLVELLDGSTRMIVDNGDQGLFPEGYESRMHARLGESEASLLGVVFTAAGVMTGAPYRVLDAAHWAFDGTGLETGDVFGRASQHMRCEGGASGHETDKISASSPVGMTILAKGTNVDKGGAELVYFETQSAGAVFSAGSITYPSGLLVNEDLSRITANVLKRLLAS